MGARVPCTCHTPAHTSALLTFVSGYRPSKLVMRVRFPSPAPAEKTLVTGPKQVAALISSGSLPKSRATDGPQQAVLCITAGLLRPSRSAGPDLLDEAAEPSADGRFKTAHRDIVQHRIANYNWDDDWVFGDPRFQLSGGPDEVLLGFLGQMVHPVVQPDKLGSGNRG
jgi:hypothetical protein